jgi:hypothetical protein
MFSLALILVAISWTERMFKQPCILEQVSNLQFYSHSILLQISQVPITQLAVIILTLPSGCGMLYYMFDVQLLPWPWCIHSLIQAKGIVYEQIL